MIWFAALVPALAGLALWALPLGRIGLGVVACTAAGATALLAAMLPDIQSVWIWSADLVLRAELTGPARAIAVAVPVVSLPIMVFASGTEMVHGLSRLLGLLLVFVGGMELILIAGDLVTLLIGWEVVGACSFGLIAHDWRRAVSDGTFAFVATRLADLGLFLALIACFAATGEIGFHALGELEGTALVIAGYGIALAAIGKAGLLPFSPWLFRAMAGPVPVSALLHSAAMVAAGVYLLARLWPFIAETPGVAPALIGLGLSTALLGGVEALRRRHVKKVLAASTSAQMGLMVATVGAGFPGVALLHLLVHAAFKAGLFLNAGLRHRASGSYDIACGAGPLVFWLTLPLTLALAAMPPLGGSWSKEEMLKAVGHAGPAWAVLFATAGGLTAAYAMRSLLAGRETKGRAPTVGIWALAAFSLATLLSCALWLPTLHELAAERMAAELPKGRLWETVLSLGLVAAGLAVGAHLARTPGPAAKREWFGLTHLLDPGLTRRFSGLCDTLARADDRLLDAIPGRAAASVQEVARRAAQGDDRWIDGMGHDAAETVSPGLVAGAARGTDSLARLSAGPGEHAAEGIPGTATRTALALSGPLRRLQTGMVHHAYTFLMLGLAVAIFLLILAG